MQKFDARTSTPIHETTTDCLCAGVEVVLPDRVVHELVSLDDDTLTVADETYSLSIYNQILVVDGGKTGDGVADALEAAFGDRIDGGVIVTPDPTPNPDGCIERLFGDHPAPSTRGAESTR